VDNNPRGWCSGYDHVAAVVTDAQNTWTRGHIVVYALLYRVGYSRCGNLALWIVGALYLRLRTI